ncbi:alpha/beta hydrolase [Nocardia sp. CDC153]|uniref:alpha/beta hydrolase n=1 Tax=Nocardia sp. CDC153 TaxID=3112167 RepID=UPI002DBA95CA|nr:alpha/beta hydrolase [Nocardia sp. CDC153]MEC3954037.1 alpha/beta hydrolase [Nocardia sp. CDC153]
MAANRIGAALLDIAEALTEASTLERVGELVRELEAEAAAHGCRVSEDGTVVGPRSMTGNTALDVIFQAGFDAKARELQARLVPLLEVAGETDERAGARLDAAATALAGFAVDPQGGGPSSRITGFLQGTENLPDDPKALYSLWNSLSPADQDALFAFDPLIGDRDGLPALARDHYNRLAVARLAEDSASEGLRLVDQHPDWSRGENLPTTADGWIRLRQWAAARDAVQTKLAGYEVLGEQSGAAGAGRLLLEVDEYGHGAIALNNPDTAANIATFVPGTGSPITAIGEGLDRSRALLGAAERADPSARTSVIAWYGYDAPPNLAEAAADWRAREGAPALDRFEEGLRATHAGLRSHNSVIGHSYGSTVIGAAASGANSLAVDAMVFVGSPGVGVGDVSELRLEGIPAGRNAAHVFATADPADPVPRFGQFLHGVDPADREFRATVFTSSGPTIDLPVVRGMPVDALAHGNYWEQGNPGLATQGEIIADRYRP